MAQGDPSLYMRSMKSEREGPDAQFMLDGFDRWAESEAPSRVGGAHKTASQFRHHRHHGRNPLKGGRRGHPMVPRRSSRSHSRSSSRSSRSSRSSSPSSSSGSESPSESESEMSVGGDMGLGRHRHRRHHHRRHHRRGRGDQVSDLDEERDGGRRRGRRHSRSSSRSSRSSVTSVPSMLSSGSGSADEREIPNFLKAGTGRRHHRHRHRHGGANIKEFADQAQSTYKAIKDKVDSYKNGYLVPSAAKDAINKVEGLADKIFGVYDFVKENVPAIKEAIAKGKANPALSALAPTLDKISTALTSAGFGKPHLEHHLRRKYGKRSHYSLMKKLMLGGSWLGDKFKELSPVLKDTGKSTIDGYIDNNPSWKKADEVLGTVDGIYKTLQSNKTNIRNLIDKSLPPATATSIKTKMTAVGLGRKGKRAPSKRNMLVSKLMREHGLSLPEASRKASQMMKGGEGL